MVIDEAGQDALALEIDDPGVGTSKGHDLAVRTDFKKQSILDGDRGRVWIGAVKGRETTVMEDQVWVHGIYSGLVGIGGIGL